MDLLPFPASEKEVRPSFLPTAWSPFPFGSELWDGRYKTSLLRYLVAEMSGCHHEKLRRPFNRLYSLLLAFAAEEP